MNYELDDHIIKSLLLKEIRCCLFREYLKTIKFQILCILKKPEKQNIILDILDVSEDIEYLKIALKIKQRQMKYGQIWQIVIGNYIHFENLNQGHSSGLDIISKKRKLIIELKNRYNTDNHSSKQTNFNKLINFKYKYPEYKCIYAVINDTHPDGKIKEILYKNEIIYYYSGDKLFEFIFGKNKYLIIPYVKNILNQKDSKIGVSDVT